MTDLLIRRAVSVGTLGASLLLFGCGGGGGDSSSSTPIAITAVISGTAASGAPIIGKVTVRDVNNKQKTVDIAANGHYSVDVTDLVAPFVFRAQGSVGGRTTTLVSAATSADVNGTINITPFTDLIIANVVGEAADKYFSSPDFSKLTAEQLTNARNTLTQRLLPALTSVGLSSSFDFLHSAFATDHTGFDAVLDVIKVSVDPLSNTALIEDLVNKTQINDDLSSKTDSTTIPIPVKPLIGMVTDLQAIEAQFNILNTLVATSLPSKTNSTLLGLFVSDGSYLDDGKNLDQFLSSILDPAPNEGILHSVFSHPTILEKMDDNNIRLSIDSRQNDHADTFDVVMRKVNGVWKIAGNQRAFKLSIKPVISRDQPAPYMGDNNKKNGNFYRVLSAYIDVDNAANTIDYVRIKGAGLPEKGVFLHRSVGQIGFVVLNSDNTDTNTSWIFECGASSPYPLAPCVNFSQVGNSTQYIAEPLDAAKVAIFAQQKFIMPSPPLSLADAKAKTSEFFTTITGVTPTTISGLSNGVNLQIRWTNPTDTSVKVKNIFYWSNPHFAIDADFLAEGATSANVVWSGIAPSSEPSITIHAEDAFGRQYVTWSRHQP